MDGQAAGWGAGLKKGKEINIIIKKEEKLKTDLFDGNYELNHITNY